LPLDPIVTRVRADMTWEQVLAKYNTSKVKAKRSKDRKNNSLKLICLNTANKQPRIWLFFEKFAKDRNFDPLVASNWYQISTKQVLMVIGKINGIKHSHLA
jgi:hypothetical protein